MRLVRSSNAKTGMTRRRIYLDFNASAPLLPAAREAMLDALDCANPSSVHAEGRMARQIVEQARRDIATLVNGRPEHVIFTSGATEAAATLLSPDWRMGRSPVRYSRAYVAASDHPCVLSGGRFPAEAVVRLPVLSDGLLDLKALASAIAAHDFAEGLPLVAMHAANGETGVIQAVEEIGRLVKAQGGLMILDAVQAAGRVSLDISAGYADFLILSGHKIGGPKGVGAIVGNSDVLLPAPLLQGGGQEKSHRAGTENVAGIAGFGAAAREASLQLASIGAIRARRDEIEAKINAFVPDAIIHGRDAPRLANTVFFTIPGLKAETAQIAFDLAGIAVSAGSACSSGKVGPSHVLQAMGVEDSSGALRVSVGMSTTDEDISIFAATLEKVMARRKPSRAA